jgi:hypothetical protein
MTQSHKGENAMTASYITPGHVRAFQAVTTQLYGEVTLASCRINGEGGVAIVLMEHAGEGKVALPFLFESNGSVTYFTNGLDPLPRSRQVTIQRLKTNSINPAAKV